MNANVLSADVLHSLLQPMAKHEEKLASPGSATK